MMSLNSTRRKMTEKLLDLSQIKVSSIFDIIILTDNDNDSDMQKLVYSTEITKWESMFMIIKFVFKDPIYLNRGLTKDKVMIIIKNPDLFVSMMTGLAIPKNSSSLLISNIPNQLPKGKTEKEVMGQIKKTESGMIVLTVTSLIVQASMKS